MHLSLSKFCVFNKDTIKYPKFYGQVEVANSLRGSAKFFCRVEKMRLLFRLRKRAMISRLQSNPLQFIILFHFTAYPSARRVPQLCYNVVPTGTEETERWHVDAHIAIFHSAYDPANSRSQRLQRDLCELPDVRLLATPYPLCAPAHWEKRGRGVGGEEEDQTLEERENRREKRKEKRSGR